MAFSRIEPQRRCPFIWLDTSGWIIGEYVLPATMMTAVDVAIRQGDARSADDVERLLVAKGWGAFVGAELTELISERLTHAHGDELPEKQDELISPNGRSSNHEAAKVEGAKPSVLPLGLPPEMAEAALEFGVLHQAPDQIPEVPVTRSKAEEWQAHCSGIRRALSEELRKIGRRAQNSALESHPGTWSR